MKKLFIAALATATTLSASANAAVVWDFIEQGNDVVGTFSGTLDLTGLTVLAQNFNPGDSFLWPDFGVLNEGIVTSRGGTNSNVTYYQITSGLPAIGSGTSDIRATSATGDAFSVDGPLLGVPLGFTGGQLAGTITFANSTFAALTITPGSSFTVTIPNDSITLNFGVQAIPLPAAAPLFATVLAGAGFAGWRRKRAAKA